MAIVEMKKCTLIALKQDEQKLLKKIQRMGCMHVLEIADKELDEQMPAQSSGDEILERKLMKLEWGIKEIGRASGEKKSMLDSFKARPVIDESGVAEALKREDEVFRAIADCEQAEKDIGAVRADISLLESRLHQLAPWESLDTPVEAITDTKHSRVFTGTIAASKQALVEEKLSELPLVSVESVFMDSQLSYIVVFAHRDAYQDAMEILRAADFTKVVLPIGEGRVKDGEKKIREEISALEKNIEEHRQTMGKNAPLLPTMKILADVYSADEKRAETEGLLRASDKCFMLEAWVPAEAETAVTEKLTAISPSIALEFRKPAEDEDAPSQMENKGIFRPFETIVENYSLPSYHGIDPVVVMAPFFACFFGMMVSDAGYGLIMAILIPLILKFTHVKGTMRKILGVVAIGGVATVIWGALFDTWFGMSNITPASIKLLNPMEDPLNMMILCIGLGVLHLFTGLGVAAYMNIKRGHPWDAVCDQLFWIFFIGGVPVLLIGQQTLGMALILIGVGGILITGGRKKKNLIGKLTGGLSSLYGVTSWLSDILSYSRLFGMGLATGVIGMVINMLAGMLPLPFAIIVLLGAHTFNLGINALGAYVHSCRLQYIEYFTKFYEADGKPFVPLTADNRYVDIKDNE
ncbi:MAG: V-type ATP synthase subunit I [Eubacteriales bacterium]|nr:V-type ATP synthase subunit I [Eubacteriales bacterium]MDD3882192.1 V-type ATP synthase subunit I [Eubacteriales bacterium]MDD4512541.1 V-type ATP synthase subunit I [Eubacteriales bacterium]